MAAQMGDQEAEESASGWTWKFQQPSSRVAGFNGHRWPAGKIRVQLHFCHLLAYQSVHCLGRWHTFHLNCAPPAGAAST